MTLVSGVMWRKRRGNVLSPGSLNLLGLDPRLPLESVEEDEANDETEVEEENHDDSGDDGGLRATNVTWVPDIISRDGSWIVFLIILVDLI